MCRCVSIIPGITMPPLASTSSVPSGTSRRGPTAAIRSPVTSTSAPVRTVCASSMVSTVPPRSTTGRPAASSWGFAIRTSGYLHADERPLHDRLSGLLPLSAIPFGMSRFGLAFDLDMYQRRSRLVRTPIMDVCPHDGHSATKGRPRMTQAQAEGSQGPLAGLLVADFSRILAGPYSTMLLADMGAEVVKVEGPGGDDTRTWQPPVRDGISTYYLGVNRNKRSVRLDLKDPGDLALARELARRAPIGALAALNPRHETGEGQHVEISLLASAMSGLVNQTSAYVAGGVVPFRRGNSPPSLFPYEPLPCAAGELIITAGNDLQFRK